MKKINTPIMIVLASVFALLAAGAGYSTKNYRASGGDRWVIGGSLDVESGGDIDVKSGGALKIAGTAVSASAAELNIMDGVTATASELNLLSGVSNLAFGTADAATSVTAVTVSGLLPGDKALVTPNEAGDTAYPLSAVASTNTLTITLSADPSTTLTIGYLVLR